MYFGMYLSDDLKGSLFALLGIAGIGCLAYISIVAFILKDKMKSIFDNLSVIYDASKRSINLISSNLLPNISVYIFLILVQNDELNEFLVEANEKSEWAYGMLFKCKVFIYFCVPTLAISSIFLTWFINGHYDLSHAFHPIFIHM